MRSRRIIIILFFLVLLFFFIFGLNFYFLNRLNEQISIKNDKTTLTLIPKSDDIEIVLRVRSKNLKPIYLNKNPRYFGKRQTILQNFIPRLYENIGDVWNVANTVSTQIFFIFCMFFYNRTATNPSKIYPLPQYHNLGRIDKWT